MFEVHLLNNDGIARAKAVQQIFETFLINLEAICGDSGREMSIVKTKLQEASFFAKRAMAMKEDNQK